MSAVTKMYVSTERANNRLKLKGFTDSELTGFQIYFGKAEMLMNPFTTAVEKIKADRNLSPEGKATKLQALKAETNGMLNGLIASEFDKSNLLANIDTIAKQKVAKIRAYNQPEDKQLAFLQQQEYRHHTIALDEKHQEKIHAPGASNAEKLDTDGPMIKAVIAAAAKYVADPKGPAHFEQNRKSELVLSAILNGPYDLVSEDLQLRIQHGLKANLAMPEMEQLRVIQGYHDALVGFGNDLRSMIAEA